MMRLTDLDPHFLKILSEQSYQFEEVSFVEAQGVQFLCPKCFESNGRSNIGVHWVICWSEGVPQTTDPKPGRWILAGTSYEDLTLNASGQRSVKLMGGCNAHFLVTNGEVTLV